MIDFVTDTHTRIRITLGRTIPRTHWILENKTTEQFFDIVGRVGNTSDLLIFPDASVWRLGHPQDRERGFGNSYSGLHLNQISHHLQHNGLSIFPIAVLLICIQPPNRTTMSNSNSNTHVFAPNPNRACQHCQKAKAKCTPQEGADSNDRCARYDDL